VHCPWIRSGRDLVQHPISVISMNVRPSSDQSRKDVDGVTMHSFAAMGLGLPGFWSLHSAGIIRLLDEYGVDLSGKHAVVQAQSDPGQAHGDAPVGRDATVTICHSRTSHLPRWSAPADIVVAAVGISGWSVATG